MRLRLTNLCAPIGHLELLERLLELVLGIAISIVSGTSIHEGRYVLVEIQRARTLMPSDTVEDQDAALVGLKQTGERQGFFILLCLGPICPAHRLSPRVRSIFGEFSENRN